MRARWGHGAGKTLFCRLLRYCLGEDQFAPEDQRLSISTGLKRVGFGRGGAERHPLGRFERPLSVGRGHFAVANVLPEQLFDRQNEPTGMEPLLNH